MTARTSHDQKVDLYVKETGPAQASTLIFLHGGGGSGWMWEPQTSALSDTYHCLVPDLPGHGQSEASGPFTMERAATQIADCIAQRAHGGRASVIGLSLGAQLGVELLKVASERIERAILSSPLLRPLPGAFMYSRSLLRWTYILAVSPFKQIEWYTRLNMRQAAGVPEMYYPQFHEDYERINADAFAQVTFENMNYRLPPSLSQVNVPVLVIVGRKELKPMQQSVRDLVAALPAAEGRVVDVGHSMAENHNWNLNAPDLFTQMVRAWVENQPLPTELQPIT